MCEAISRGNINQIGRNAWGSMIDQARELVLDHINDVKLCPRNNPISAERLERETLQKQAALKKYLSDKGYAANDERLTSDEEYIRMAKEIEECKISYATKINKYTYPQLFNDTVPTEMYSITYNNSWDFCFGFMTTCMKCDDLEKWYDIASVDPDKSTEIQVDHEERKTLKESLRSLSDCFNHPNYYACTGGEGETCPLPNCKKTPDIVVAIIPDDTKTHLKIPVFVFEVIGMKKIWNANERHFPGFVATLPALAFAPYAYYGEVDGDTVSLYHFQKVAAEGRIHISREDYTYAIPGAIAEVFGQIFTRFVDIFTDIFLNCSWINHESARILSLAEYQNFVATLNKRNTIDVEMHCWHLFDETYFCQDKRPAPEFTAYDFTDPSNPIPNDQLIDMRTFDYKVPADEMVPAVSSNTKIDKLKETYTRVMKKTEYGSMCDLSHSRAVRHHVTGQPLDPLRGEHWHAAFNKFHSNISAYFRKHYPTHIDRLNHYGRLHHADFQEIFNPHLRPRPNAQKKTFTDQIYPDQSAEVDYVADSDDSDEDFHNSRLDKLCSIIKLSENETPRRFGRRQGHRPPRPPIHFGPPRGGWTDTGPPSGPSSRGGGKYLYV